MILFDAVFFKVANMYNSEHMPRIYLTRKNGSARICLGSLLGLRLILETAGPQSIVNEAI